MVSFDDIVFQAQPLSFRDFSIVKNDNDANRICFKTSHSNALTAYRGKYPYKFSIPFYSTVGPIFENETGINLWASKMGKGFWAGLTNVEKNQVEKWINSRLDLVFLRDILDSSMCLSEHMDYGKGRTNIGELENRAKYHADADAISKLINLLADAISGIANYRDAAAVAHVPPRPGKARDLPTELARGVGAKLKLPNFEAGNWKGDKGQLKELDFEARWKTLEAAGFEPNSELKQYPKVVLLDDLYQSGCTMNFVGAQLKNELRIRVLGLCVAKSARDTDNI